MRNTFYGLLLLFITWIFAIPEFPTLDGPLHLYYAHVLGKLLSGDQHFQHYYQIRHYLPPYSTHIYVFLALERLLPLALVTKTMTAICFVLNAVGLRFLIRSLNPRESVFSILAIPLSLSWPLFMGFFPYLLGLGLTLFAAGLWCGIAAGRSRSNVAAFLCLVALSVLTHPLTLLLLMFFCASELLARYLRQPPGTSLRPYFPDLAILCGAALMCCYVLFFMGSNPSLTEPASKQPLTFTNILTAEYVTPFVGRASYILRFALVLLLFFLVQCSFFELPHRFRKKQWDTSDVLGLSAILLLAILPLLPFRVNGAAFFSQRLVLIVWVVFMAAAGTHLRLAPRTLEILCVMAISLSLLTLGLAHSRVMAVAREVANVPPLDSGPYHVGFLLSPFPDPPQNGLAFNPFLLSGVKVFLQSDAVLLNSPWLVSPASPLRGRNGTLTDMSLGHPVNLARTLRSSAEMRATLTNMADFLVIAGGQEQQSRTVLENLFNSRKWRCSTTTAYSVCQRAKE